MDTPILTTTDCEGAGETFLVKSTSKTEEDQVSAPLHLTVSAQLHLEALALGMSKVGEFTSRMRHSHLTNDLDCGVLRGETKPFIKV